LKEEEMIATSETKLRETKLPRLLTQLPGPKAKHVLEQDTKFMSPSFTRDYEMSQRHRARVTVRLGSGAVLVGESGGEFGDIADAMSPRDVDAKFLSLTAGVLGERQALSALERLRGLDSEAVASDVLSELELSADDGAKLPALPTRQPPPESLCGRPVRSAAAAILNSMAIVK